MLKEYTTFEIKIFNLIVYRRMVKFRYLNTDVSKY